MRLFISVFRRDLLVVGRQLSDVFSTLTFFVIVVTVFPLALGSDKQLLRDLAPAVVWVSALLAATLSITRLFSSDYADGSLEQMVLGSEPLSVIVLAKVATHWLTSGFPLVVLAPIIAVLFDLPALTANALTIGLLIGTPIFSLVGAIGSALTLGVRGNSVLVTVLLLPLYVPVLIFGAGAARAGASTETGLLLLGAGLATALALGPWVTAAALRVSLE